MFFTRNFSPYSMYTQLHYTFYNKSLFRKTSAHSFIIIFDIALYSVLVSYPQNLNAENKTGTNLTKIEVRSLVYSYIQYRTTSGYDY